MPQQRCTVDAFTSQGGLVRNSEEGRKEEASWLVLGLVSELRWEATITLGCYEGDGVTLRLRVRMKMRVTVTMTVRVGYQGWAWEGCRREAKLTGSLSVPITMKTNRS